MIRNVDHEKPWFKEQHCYQCHYCERWSLKDEWGPGWVTCPYCKKQGPTVAELRAGQKCTYTMKTTLCYTTYEWRCVLSSGHDGECDFKNLVPI